MQLSSFVKVLVVVGLVALSGFAGHSIGYSAAEDTAQSEISELQYQKQALDLQVSTSQKLYTSAVESYNELYDSVVQASTYRPPVNKSLYCSSTSYGTNYQYSSTYCF